MSEFAAWILELVIEVFKVLWNFITDIVIAVVDLFLTALLAVISALPLPSFLQNGLQGLINAIPGDVWFFATHFHLGECLAMFGAAVTFRMARKAVTLFQW